jgi:hypothetical protein
MKRLIVALALVLMTSGVAMGGGNVTFSIGIGIASSPILTLHPAIRPTDTLITVIRHTAMRRRTVTVIIRDHITVIIMAGIRTGHAHGVVIIAATRTAPAGTAITDITGDNLVFVEEEKEESGRRRTKTHSENHCFSLPEQLNSLDLLLNSTQQRTYPT